MKELNDFWIRILGETDSSDAANKAAFEKFGNGLDFESFKKKINEAVMAN